MAESTEQLIEIISRPVDGRSQADIESIIPWVQCRAQIMRHIDKRDLVEILKLSKYERVSKDQIIIKQGELGVCMFILLRGSALVYIDTSLTGEEESRLPVHATARLPKSTQTEMTSRHKLTERNNLGKYIMRYSAGKHFGEVALLSEDKYRNATVVAEENCDLMVIGQELFDKILRVSLQREYDQVCQFINCSPHFSHLTPKFKRLLELSLRKDYFPYGASITRQGRPVTTLFFLLDGQANMVIEPNAYQKQYPKLWPFEAGIDLYSQEFEYLRKSRRNAILRKYEDPAVLPIKSDHLIVKRTEGYAAAEKMVQERSICLCTIHGGEVIGDLEVVQNLGTYMSTVTCTAPTTVFVLDVRNLERLTGKRNPMTLEIMKEKAKEKLQRRASSCLGRDVTFLNYLLYKITEGSLPLFEKQKLPPIKSSKYLPDKDVQIQHLLAKFKDGQAQLIEPRVPGALIYKEQMQEKAKIRANSRRRGANEISAKLREARQRIASRQPRSRHEIVKALKESMESELAEYTHGYKSDVNLKQSRKLKQDESVKRSGDNGENKLDENQSKNVHFEGDFKENISDENMRNTEDVLRTGEYSKYTGTISRSSSNDLDNSRLGNLKDSLHLVANKSNMICDDSGSATMNDLVAARSDSIDMLTRNRPMADEKSQTARIVSYKSDYQTKEHTAVPNILIKLSASSKAGLELTGNVSATKWQSAAKLVHARIRDRFTGQLLSHEAGFDDYETSENNLNLLENRIRTFFASNFQSQIFGNKSNLVVPKLRRFNVQHQDAEAMQPKPGGKVWVHKKLCRYANNSVKVCNHEHIRYHMLPELPQFRNLQKTRVILHHLLSGALTGNTSTNHSLILPKRAFQIDK